MDIITWLVLGFLAGWIASLILNTDTVQSALLDIVLGIIGALSGGLILNVFGRPGITGLTVYSIAVAALGSIVLIWLGRTLHIESR